MTSTTIICCPRIAELLCRVWLCVSWNTVGATFCRGEDVDTSCGAEHVRFLGKRWCFALHPGRITVTLQQVLAAPKGGPGQLEESCGILWWLETIWELICDNLTLAVLRVQRTILFTMLLYVIVLCCLHIVLSPNRRRILYTLNIIEHHRMMKTNPHCHCALQALLHNNACIFLNIATLPLAVTRSGRCDRYIDRSRAWAVTCLKRRSRLRSGVGNQGMV